jgi:hypothetical protein
VALVDAGVGVNEVEAAGNTPLHSAAYEGWVEGAELLLQLGAKVNASNNAGDTPWVSCSWLVQVAAQRCIDETQSPCRQQHMPDLCALPARARPTALGHEHGPHRVGGAPGGGAGRRVLRVPGCDALPFARFALPARARRTDAAPPRVATTAADKR